MSAVYVVTQNSLAVYHTGFVYNIEATKVI